MKTFKEEFNIFCAVLSIATMIIGLGVLAANHKTNETIYISRHTQYIKNQSCVIGLSLIHI